MEKKDTIADTMRAFMASGPSVTEYPTYRALNDAVGAVHGKAEGKVQTLAGESAWAWTPDPTTKTWRRATDVEIESRRQKAAGKAHGTRGAKVLSPEDRESLEAQISALVVVGNPALKPLLSDLLARRNADDVARKGSLKDRLAAAVERLGLARAVDLLEAAEPVEA